LSAWSFGQRAMSARAWPVAAVAASLVGLAAPPAPAKEHTAACAELGGMIARVRSSLQAASSQRLRGSSLGAYQVLHVTTESMARDSDGRHCGALGPTLTAALTRAAASRTALEASIELDQGLDAALSLASDGRLLTAAPPKLLPVTEAALYAQDCPDLFRLSQRLDGPREAVRQRVAAILADLRAQPRCGLMRRVLEKATPERLAYAVDSIRLDEPDEADSAADLTSRCPELPLVIEKLAATISVGAPQYNAGDARACRRTYQEAAKALATKIIPDGRCPTVRALLAAGLARARGAPDDRQAAWDLRHSFDAILSDEQPSGEKPAGAP
jgi:hypothetical protein